MKSPLFAAAGASELWIVDLDGRGAVDVHRRAAPDDYGQPTRHDSGELRPTALPAFPFAIAAISAST